MRRVILACALAGVLSVPAFGQGVDPLIGTWKFNPEKCTFVGGPPPPKSQTLTWSVEGQTLIDNVETVDAEGRASKGVVIHIYDGQPHPTTGGPDWDSTAFTRLGNILSWVRFKNGKLVQAGQGIIVPGKTYTLIAGGIDTNNQPNFAIVVYDRQ